MRLEKLKVGKQFKNYIELCKALGVESAKGGRNRKLQQDYFRRFFEWEVDGRKITITKIHQEPIEFVETRGGANNNVYVQHIDPILTSCFASMECKETYVTINQLAERLGIINSNYRELSYSKEEFVDYLKKTNGNVNETAVNNVFYSINDIVTRAVTSSMDRLVKAGVIDYEKDYIIHERSQEDEEEYIEPRLADEEEVKVIIESENTILKEMNIEKSDLRDSDKLRKEYYDRVNGLVIKRLDYIVYYYKGYKVTISLL